MTTSVPDAHPTAGTTATTTTPAVNPVTTAAEKAHRGLTSPWASLFAILLAFLWTLPTFGLLVTSFRPQREIGSSGWWTAITDPNFTLSNYEAVLSSTGRASLADYFVNSFIITIPSVIIPVFLALLAAYTFAWVEFKGRSLLFVAIFALQIVPIQVTLIPLLRLYVDTDLAGSFWAIWLSHSIFALPLAIFLLHNFMREIPRELLEAARVDGAGHVQILFRVLMPLLTPALAAFGIFQFLWVWNDLLMALVFVQRGDQWPMTRAVQALLSQYGNEWHLLAAGAFLLMVVPMLVFFALQRYFVQGLLAGSVK
ncbi:MAG TPA: carbohydrate ABC transporter permease [Mycobacteriales bacterium]|nr:carbohydrate ABC transporter permease [Mycobacteriales bacterium]